MLYLNSNEEKTLTFEVDINGVGCEDLCGSVRFLYEDVEYGFPISIDSNTITSVIKPLDNLIENMKNGTIIPARLELNTKDYFFSPWQGEIKVQSPVKVEAKLQEEAEDSVTIKARVVESRKPSKEQVISERKETKKTRLKQALKNMTEEDIYSYMSRAGTKNKQIQEIVLTEARNKAESRDILKVFKNVVNALKKPKK